MSYRCLVVAAWIVVSVGILQEKSEAQNTIYQDSFNGSGDPLHGVAPDVNPLLSSWQAADLFTDDGVIQEGDNTVTNRPEGAALLPFTPVDGFTYTLEVNVFNNGSGWVGIGFMDGNNSGNLDVPQARHAQAGGWAWMLTRSGTGNDQEAFNGRNTASSAFGGDLADPTQAVDIKIVLDTTGGTGAWTAEYFLGNVSQAGGAFALDAASSNIAFVGISRDVPSNDTTPAAMINSFSLTTNAGVFDAADVNEDGMIDEEDYFIIRDNLFETEILGLTVVKTDGDITKNGVVDLADFRLWKDFAPTSALIAAGIIVPEPGSLVFVLSAILSLAGAGRRRRTLACSNC